MKLHALAALGGLMLAGCGASGSASGTGGTSVAATTSAPSRPAGMPPLAPSAAAVQPALETVPVILVHGINSRPGDFGSICSALAPGRAVVRELFAREADALQPGSLSPDVVAAVGYYKETAQGPDTHDGSIGGCPTPRSDGVVFATSYAERLRRCVEGVRRATGAPRVDLVLHSMGGIVGRSFTKWLSLDANGRSSVRRIFTIGSPWRGVNALESTITAFSQSGPLSHERDGECVELCSEASVWNGRSFIEELNQDWDSFCSARSIRYAGLSLLGERGAAAGKNPTSPNGMAPTNPLPGGGYLTGREWAVQAFVGALGTFSPVDLAKLPLLPRALANLPREVGEALGPGDGVVRLASSRLDEAPFHAAAFHGMFEGAHANLPDPERGFASTYTLECVRAFCLDSSLPLDAKCRSIDIRVVRAPGRATWLVASLDVAGRGALAIQLVEEPLDASGDAIYGIGYGAPLRGGAQSVPFVVMPGGGTRRYRATVYGPQGPIGASAELVVTLEAGVGEVAPLATLGTPRTVAAPAGPIVEVPLASNASAGDPTAAVRVRLDAGDWSDWSTTATLATPPLAPGVHRLEVVARHSSNGASVLVEQGEPTAIGLHVDASGGVSVVR